MVFFLNIKRQFPFFVEKREKTLVFLYKKKLVLNKKRKLVGEGGFYLWSSVDSSIFLSQVNFVNSVFLNFEYQWRWYHNTRDWLCAKLATHNTLSILFSIFGRSQIGPLKEEKVKFTVPVPIKLKRWSNFRS